MPELTPLDDNRQEHFLNGEDLEPITRREHFYAGRESELPAGHREPETREEWFIQKYRGGGGDVTVVPLSVTDNGTYSEEGKAYSPVSVDVPLPQNAYLLKSVANLPQAIASFSDGEDMVMPSLKVAIEPQQEGSGDPSPTNIRPISGWDEVNVGVNNGNWWDEEYQIYGSGATARIGSKNPIPCKPNTTYYITKPPAYGWKFYDKDMNVLATYYNQTYTTPSNCYYMLFQLDESYGTTYNNDVCINTISTDYYTPYNGHTYTIDLDGTRYGGEVDVVSGVLTVDKVYVVYDGSADENWFKYGSGSASAFAMCSNNALLSNINAIPMASYLKGISRNETWGNYDNWVSVTSGDRLVTGMQSITEVEDWKTYLSSNNLQVVYELATPLTIQLTPTAVKSLHGVNNVYANTGNIKDAKYFSKEV